MGSPPNGDVVLCPATRRVPPSQLTITRNTSNALSPYPDCLQVAHINSRSLLWHIDEARRIFTPLPTHAFLISESWLKPNLSSMLVSLSGYKVLRNDRINKGVGGGGVALYVRDNIKHRILSSSPSEYAGKLEFIITELTIPPNKVLLAVVYRPFTSTAIFFFLGDFNINLLSNTNEANKLLTTLSDFKNIDTDKLNSDAALTPWHEINVIDILEEKISRFSQMITDLYSRTVPLITREVTKPPAPWLTNYIVQLMIKRDNAYSR
ncbi:hypothetical protein PR048_004196 [Dryococelus australis]|uniref:Endonuclease/exonuclease/phosphatase domain-containing protein n=1 Tax=Dryococelus australis TaxID=614101 RepID=A0ABQ9I6Q8_9NEOP|nr:hypothetical protein PR048_004196 [Dryococelus australis]